MNLFQRNEKKPERKIRLSQVSTMLELQSAMGEDQVLLDPAQRKLYCFDGITIGEIPVAVVLPKTTEEVVTVVKLAKLLGFPVVARGAASGLSGGSVPVKESIVISFTRMTRLLIEPERLQAVAQPGVVTATIGEKAKSFGLGYPPDPASFRTSTIGGNLAENAGGPMCFKKGVTGDYVPELEYVDADGLIHRVKRDAYDVPGLMIGSEGTLGLITEVKLRLERLPKYTQTLMAVFDEVGKAAEAVSEAIASGAVPSKLEFMDNGCIRAVESFLKMGLPVDAAAILMIDTDGDNPMAVQEELNWAAEACRNHGGEVKVAQDGDEAEALWRARRSISSALGRIRPKRLNEDIAIPRSKLAAVVREIEMLGKQYGFPLVQFGHIGDGNLHPNVLFDPDKDDEAKVWELLHDVGRVALRAGGVLSGEHGIGLMKRDFMAEAVDSVTLNALRDVKFAFDEWNVLNPGKVLPDPLNETLQ